MHCSGQASFGISNHLSSNQLTSSDATLVDISEPVFSSNWYNLKKQATWFTLSIHDQSSIGRTVHHSSRSSLMQHNGYDESYLWCNWWGGQKLKKSVL